MIHGGDVVMAQTLALIKTRQNPQLPLLRREIVPLNLLAVLLHKDKATVRQTWMSCGKI